MLEKFCPFAGGILSLKREKNASVSLEPEPQNGAPQPVPLRTMLRFVRSRPLAQPHGSGRGPQVRDPDHTAGWDDGSSTRTPAPRSTRHWEGQIRGGLGTIPESSHPRGHASRVDALALAPSGTRARRPSRLRVIQAPRHTPLSLAAVLKGHRGAVETACTLASHPLAVSPPCPSQPLCPSRLRSTMAWRSRGQARQAWPLWRSGLKSAGLYGAPTRRRSVGADACPRVYINRQHNLKGTVDAKKRDCDATAARILRVFGPLSNPVSFRTACASWGGA
jgi:hypothetical protein